MTLIWDRGRYPNGPPPIEIMRDPIREGLRELVRRKVIWAWPQPQDRDGTRMWRVVPMQREDGSWPVSVPYDDAGIIEYLRLAGVWNDG